MFIQNTVLENLKSAIEHLTEILEIHLKDEQQYVQSHQFRLLFTHVRNRLKEIDDYFEKMTK